MNANWVRVTKAKPCSVCGRDHWCAVGRIDGTPKCMWAISARPARGGGWLHPLDGDQRKQPRDVPSDLPPVKVVAWSVLADAYVRAVNARAIAAFATSMTLTVAALADLHTGWDGEAWTTPMRNAKRRVVGLQRRFGDGSKRCWTGSKAGLFIPDSLNGENPVWIAEGASDTAALAGIGLPVVGLFNAGGNAEQIVQLLDGRRAILVADNDEPTPPGRVGGRERTAAFIVRLRSIGVQLEVVHPVNAKDARAALAIGWRPGQKNLQENS